MNPVEIHQFLTNLFRNGAEAIATAVVAFIAGGLAGLWWQKRASADKLAGIPKLEKDLAEAREAVATLKLELGEKLHDLEAKLIRTQVELENTRVEREKAIRSDQQHCAETSEAQKKCASLQQQADDVAARLQETLAVVARQERQIHDADLATTEFEDRIGVLNVELEEFKKKSGETEEARRRYSSLYSRKCKELRRLTNHLSSVVAQGGRIWERPLAKDAPRFVPLDDRKCTIVSVLNLKGGVGKTTLVLNIAATLASQGKRVLMIDLDHQRTLSALCLLSGRRKKLHEESRALQHFLQEPEAKPERFLSCVYPLGNIPGCSIVINSDPREGTDGLANTEETLMFSWLTRLGSTQDVRMLLRRALHSSLVSEKFDFIFIDCPPRLGTASINGLAASDFVLMPVVLDAASSAIPIPHLLTELRRLNAPSLFPDFSLLGLVANRVHYVGATIVGNQMAVWESLAQRCQDAWGRPVNRFRTLLRHSAAFSKVVQILIDEQDSTTVLSDTAMQDAFTSLVTEILQRIKHESKQPSTVHS